MILTKIRIKNFRSILDSGEIHLAKDDLITAIAGQNESGKTAFLKALKYFEEGKYVGFDDDARLCDDYPRVEATFCLKDDEFELFKNEYGLEIAKYFKNTGITFSRGKEKEANDENINYIKFDDSVIKAIDSLNASKEPEDAKITVAQIVERLSGIRPKFIYYSGELDSNILPGEIMVSEIQNNQAVKDFEKVYDIDFAELFTNKYNNQKRTYKFDLVSANASDSLNSFWNQKISGEKSEYKYKISFSENSADLLLSKLQFYIANEDGIPLKMSQKSDGFRWFSGFTLRLRAHGVNPGDSHGFILLLDEPGLGLHEIGQRDVRHVIDEISGKSNIQVILSSHLPLILGGDKIKFNQILLATKNRVGNSSFGRINQVSSSDGAMDALSPIRSAIGLVSVSGFSKGEKVVVVEGISDYYFLRTLLDDSVKIIPAFGADNVRNVFAILFGWGVEPRAIFDGDSKGVRAYRNIKSHFAFQDDMANHMLFTLKDGKIIEDLVSPSDIKRVLDEFDGVKYKSDKSNLDNVEQPGKNLFFFRFYDMYGRGDLKLSKVTLNNVKELLDFINS